jgi:hypothetical protein
VPFPFLASSFTHALTESNVDNRMHPTATRHRMASTRGGMRRILKQRLPTVEYIRRAVETGVYRSNDELEKVRKERRDSADDLKTIMNRFRQDVVRGSNIHDYPIEYRILKQHPPLPDPPRIPARIAKKMKERDNPAEKLVHKILERQQQQGGSGFASKKKKASSFSKRGGGGTKGGAGASGAAAAPPPPQTTDEYYRRLFGASARAPSRGTAMGQKPAYVQKAYAAAIKCFELQRTTPGGLSEDEALARVDELLAEQEQHERTKSSERAKWAQEYAKQQQQQQKQSKEAAGEVKKVSPTRAAAASDGTTVDGGAAAEDPTGSSNGDETALRSIFADNPRGIEGMMKWGERLSAVPYRHWTVGASTALDHWIARQVLRLSEETWEALLEGSTDPGLLSRGRDIIKVRQSLFPETLLGFVDAEPILSSEDDQHDADAEENLSSSSPSKDSTEKTIDELLASLGGLSMPAGTSSSKGGGDKASHQRSSSWLDLDDDDDATDLDRKVTKLVNELQDWRRRNVEQPYAAWPKSEKEEFDAWMRRYVSAVSSDAARATVDYDSTREALLSQPPVAEDDAAAFWDSLQDEGRAVALLETMRHSGPPPGASILHAAFWELPYHTQLERLMNLGALRPLLDEYAKESDRIRFLQRYGDTLLAGVELEHLVPDPNGPVRAGDLGPAAAGLNVASDDRFRLALLPYRGSPDLSADERSRALFAAWNEHKAGRARYEEKLFRTGRLGLRYDDEDPESNV